MIVLVTGATGFFGRLLVQYLVQDPNIKVLAGVRALTDSFCEGVEEIVLGDLTKLANLKSIFEKVDCIVHCAARAHVLKEDSHDPLHSFMEANCSATLNLAHQAAAAGVKRLIFLSSIGVNGSQTFGTPFCADDMPAPVAPYAISKWAAEKGLKKIAEKTNLEVVIIRPPLIIGPNPVGNLLSLSRMIEKGVPLPFGLATKNRRSLVSAHTLANLVYICLSHNRAPGKVLMAADLKPNHTLGILDRLAEETGQSLRIVPIPIPLLNLILRVLGFGTMANQLFGDLEVDVSETINRLDWNPSTNHRSFGIEKSGNQGSSN